MIALSELVLMVKGVVAVSPAVSFEHALMPLAPGKGWVTRGLPVDLEDMQVSYLCLGLFITNLLQHLSGNIQLTLSLAQLLPRLSQLLAQLSNLLVRLFQFISEELQGGHMLLGMLLGDETDDQSSTHSMIWKIISCGYLVVLFQL